MVALFVLAACSSIDCPLNNRVYATFRLDAGMKTMEDTFSWVVYVSIAFFEIASVLPCWSNRNAV